MKNVIKNQKYQTRKEVSRAANTGRETAIWSSIRHWKELATAPVKDLTIVTIDPQLGVADCAMCVQNKHCNTCPLFLKTGLRCYDGDNLYSLASAQIGNYRHSYIKSRKDMYIKRFRRAAEKMVKILESCL